MVNALPHAAQLEQRRGAGRHLGPGLYLLSGGIDISPLFKLTNRYQMFARFQGTLVKNNLITQATNLLIGQQPGIIRLLASHYAIKLLDIGFAGIHLLLAAIKRIGRQLSIQMFTDRQSRSLQVVIPIINRLHIIGRLLIAREITLRRFIPPLLIQMKQHPPQLPQSDTFGHSASPQSP